MASNYIILKTKDTEKEFKFPKNVFHHIKEFKNRTINKLDNIVLITGMVGSGKSNLLTGIGGVWEEQFHNRKFGLPDIYFNSEKILTEMNRLDNKTKFLGFDEAIQGSSGRDTLTKMGQIFRKGMISKRFKQHLIAFCVDSLKELNDKIIERACVWYHVSYRRLPSGNYQKGLFKVFTKKDALKVYEDLKTKKVFTTEEHYIYNNNRQWYHSTDYMGLWFDEIAYDTKKGEETDLLSDEENPHLIQRNKLIIHLMNNYKVKQQEIADVIGVSRPYISQIKTNM
jgi:hypothetical protein